MYVYMCGTGLSLGLIKMRGSPVQCVITLKLQEQMSGCSTLKYDMEMVVEEYLLVVNETEAMVCCKDSLEYLFILVRVSMPNAFFRRCFLEGFIVLKEFYICF